MEKITNPGLIKSPPDNRDYALSSYTHAIKRYPKDKPCPYNLHIQNQWFNPSCVGHSCSTVKEGLERIKRNVKILDGEWLYNECKKVDGIPDFSGTYLRTGLKVLKELGIKPADGGDPAEYKIKAYARVDDLSFEGIKRYLSVYHFLIAGFHGSNEGWGKEVIRPPKEGESIWGHAVSIIGYDENHLLGQNSWGDFYWVHGNSGGYFKAPKDYLPFEAWAVLLDAPNEIEHISDKIQGYVASEFTKIHKGQRITTHNLNLRREPTTSSDVIQTIPKGTAIKTNGDIIESIGFNWIPVL
jgi:hypothetical protein